MSRSMKRGGGKKAEDPLRAAGLEARGGDGDVTFAGRTIGGGAAGEELGQMRERRTSRTPSDPGRRAPRRDRRTDFLPPPLYFLYFASPLRPPTRLAAAAGKLEEMIGWTRERPQPGGRAVLSCSDLVQLRRAAGRRTGRQRADTPRD